jgi:hypothetical protein
MASPDAAAQADIDATRTPTKAEANGCVTEQELTRERRRRSKRASSQPRWRTLLFNVLTPAGIEAWEEKRGGTPWSDAE